ncbi:T6SS effector BTH_I2691 family protein [Providencia rettgeri]|uniref:T6SS effector BTH_I2691 family protein n=1 Tax=Providencia rettgeri TaxID=587 RepID=UPI0034E06A52
MSCNFCERRGVAILPVRSAINKKNSGAPELPPEFSVSVSARGEIKYTARLLRKGYLHVFDENREIWTDYIITEDGYYWKITSDTPSIIPKLGQKPCASNPNEVARASFISLPLALNPNDNGRFWFAWSQYAWTDAVREMHHQTEVREKNMQCFDLKLWLSAKKADQTVPLTQLRQVVAEYCDTKIPESSFEFYSSPWLIKTKSDGDFLLNTATNLACSPLKPDSSRAAIIHLQDPIAISEDLSQLMLQSHDNFQTVCKNNPKLSDFERKLASFSNMTLAEYNVKENNKRQQFLATEELENKAYFGDGETFIWPSIAEKNAKKIRDYTNENYESWADNEWDRYLAHTNKNNIEQFKHDFDTQKKEYESNYEHPLFDMYLATLKHSFFINYFIYNFDKNNKTSGGNYIDTLSSCLIGSQLSSECADYIETQLNGNFLDTKNIFMRAYIFNQNDTTQFYKEHIPKSIDNLQLKSLPWGNLFSFHSEIISKLADNINFHDKLNTLNYVLAAPIIRVLKNASLYKTSSFPVLLAINENSPLISMLEKNTRNKLSKKLTEVIVRETFNGHGMKPMEKNNARKIFSNAIESQIKQQGIADTVLTEMGIKNAHGGNLTGDGVLRSNVLLTENMHFEFKGKTPTQILEIAKDITNNITTSEQAHNFYLKQKLSVTAATGGIASILFQLAAIASMVEQESAWYGGIKTHSAQRLSASWIGVTGATLEFAFASLNAGAKGALTEVRWFRVLSRAAKGVSIVGIAILAYLDLLDANKEELKGNIILTRLYYFSSFLGFLLIVCILGKIPVLGVIISLIYVATAFYIEYYKPNDLMIWMNKCMYFGKNNEGLFTLAKDEDEAFAKLWDN